MAELVASVTDDVPTIAAAWLHDIVEDTLVTIDKIQLELGSEIAGLVADVTNVSRPLDGNRAKRKSIDYAHTAQADPRAKTIKIGRSYSQCFGYRS